MSNTGIKKESFKKNFNYQIIYQIIILIIPFIAAPYLTRVLGDEALGEYTFVNSISSYFVTFAGLGIGIYGIRLVSVCRDDNERLRKEFWSLYITHFVVSLISLLSYIIFCNFMNETIMIYYIEIIFVASSVFDITWLFSGLENFKTVVLRNLFIKVLTLICIFVFVKSKDDLYIYVIIMASSTFLSQLLLIPFALIHIKPVKVSFKDCIKHLKPMIILFMGSVAAILYTTFDKTLLGLMTTKQDVAYYAYADKIIVIPKSIMAVITTVTIPRVCSLLSKGKIEETKKYISMSILFVTFLGMATMFGLLAIGKQFAILYYGESFAFSGVLVMLMSPLPYVILIGTIARQEYLFPMNKDIIAQTILIISAILNLVASFLFIHFFGPKGVVLGTFLSEGVGTLLDVFFARKLVTFKEIIQILIPFAIFGFVMYLVLFFIQKQMEYSYLNLVILFLIGSAIYCLLSIMYLLIFYKDKIYFRDKIKFIFQKKNLKKEINGVDNNGKEQ